MPETDSSRVAVVEAEYPEGDRVGLAVTVSEAVVEEVRDTVALALAVMEEEYESDPVEVTLKLSDRDIVWLHVAECESVSVDDVLTDCEEEGVGDGVAVPLMVAVAERDWVTVSVPLLVIVCDMLVVGPVMDLVRESDVVSLTLSEWVKEALSVAEELDVSVVLADCVSV